MHRPIYNLSKYCFLLAIAAFLLLSRFLSARADEAITCTDSFPEGPVVENHLEQADINAGVLSFDEIFEAGERLFKAKFNLCDGQGRPAATGTGDAREPVQPNFTRISAPDSDSCDGCHNQPRSGGGGDFVANVFVLGQAADPVLASTDGEFSNNRNTLGMFGSGAIEMLAREMTAELVAIREEAIAQAQGTNAAITAALEAKGIDFGEITVYADGTVDASGVKGVDPDLIIKPFHQAGVVVSLREFTDNAMNHHHGMQAEERFDLNPEKGPDFDQDGIAHELTIGDLTALSVYQAALGVPGRLMPAETALQEAAAQGETLFSQIGCADCHVPELELESRIFSEPNPYNPAGTWSDMTAPYSFDMTTTGEGPYLERSGEGAVVRAYTDLKRHNLCDDPGRADAIRHFCNEQLSQTRPDQDGRPGAEFFLTRKLWDVGNSAPYGHVGDLTTITEAILMHGGEGRFSRDTFVRLSLEEQSQIVTFLKTLQVLPVGSERVVVEGQVLEQVSSAQPAGPSKFLLGGMALSFTVLALGVIVVGGIILACLMLAVGVIVGRRSAHQ